MTGTSSMTVSTTSRVLVCSAHYSQSKMKREKKGPTVQLGLACVSFRDVNKTIAMVYYSFADFTYICCVLIVCVAVY